VRVRVVWFWRLFCWAPFCPPLPPDPYPHATTTGVAMRKLFEEELAAEEEEEEKARAGAAGDDDDDVEEVDMDVETKEDDTPARAAPAIDTRAVSGLSPAADSPNRRLLTPNVRVGLLDEPSDAASGVGSGGGAGGAAGGAGMQLHTSRSAIATPASARQAGAASRPATGAGSRAGAGDVGAGTGLVSASNDGGVAVTGSTAGVATDRGAAHGSTAASARRTGDADVHPTAASEGDAADRPGTAATASAASSAAGAAGSGTGAVPREVSSSSLVHDVQLLDSGSDVPLFLSPSRHGSAAVDERVVVTASTAKAGAAPHAASPAADAGSRPAAADSDGKKQTAKKGDAKGKAAPAEKEKKKKKSRWLTFGRKQKEEDVVVEEEAKVDEVVVVQEAKQERPRDVWEEYDDGYQTWFWSQRTNKVQRERPEGPDVVIVPHAFADNPALAFHRTTSGVPNEVAGNKNFLGNAGERPLSSAELSRAIDSSPLLSPSMIETLPLAEVRTRWFRVWCRGWARGLGCVVLCCGLLQRLPLPPAPCLSPPLAPPLHFSRHHRCTALALTWRTSLSSVVQVRRRLPRGVGPGAGATPMAAEPSVPVSRVEAIIKPRVGKAVLESATASAEFHAARAAVPQVDDHYWWWVSEERRKRDMERAADDKRKQTRSTADALRRTKV
jgi:hypothetical protein